MLAMKFNDDCCFSNTYNAMVSGVDKDELLLLELTFLKLIDFRVHVSPDTFQDYYKHLIETSERQATLYNCSCLDPSHSYGMYRKMIKSQSYNHPKRKERGYGIKSCKKTLKDNKNDHHKTCDSESQVFAQADEVNYSKYAAKDKDFESKFECTFDNNGQISTRDISDVNNSFLGNA